LRRLRPLARPKAFFVRSSTAKTSLNFNRAPGSGPGFTSRGNHFRSTREPVGALEAHLPAPPLAWSRRLALARFPIRPPGQAPAVAETASAARVSFVWPSGFMTRGPSSQNLFGVAAQMPERRPDLAEPMQEKVSRSSSVVGLGRNAALVKGPCGSPTCCSQPRKNCAVFQSARHCSSWLILN